MSKNSLSLSDNSARELSLHLWPGASEHRPTDWRALHSVLRRRLPLLLAIFAATLALTLLALTLLPPLYRASATLQVNTASANSSETDLPVLSDLTGSQQGRSLVTQTEILNNDAVRDRAFTLLSPDLRAKVNFNSLAVKSTSETDLITVSATSSDARAASALANALCRSYLELSREKNRSQYSAARQYLGVQLNATRTRLNRAREALKRYKQRNNTVDLTAETQGQIGELNRLESEWRQARANAQASQSQLARLKSVEASLPATIVSSRTVGRRPALVTLQARLTQLELERIEALKEFVPSSPEVGRLNAEIGALRARLQSEAQTEVQSLQQSPNPAKLEAQQSILRLQSEISSFGARTKALQTLSARVKSELARLPEREQRLGQLTTELSGLEQSYGSLNQKYQTLRASEAARAASGSLLFAATTPTAPQRRLTPFNLAFCFALATLLALGISALVDRMDAHVHSARDLENLSDMGDLQVLAQIPANADPSARCLINTEAMISPLLENFRMLRTSLALSSQLSGESAKMLAVTSSLPKEGKSLTSVNLAVAAALSGETVILVDCDLHLPSLHDLCGRTNRSGFVNVAQGEVTLESALQATRVPNLFLLTSGPAIENPFRILNSRAGRDLLQRLSELADLVVVDTPPVLVLADARVVASLADSVLLVVSTEEPHKDDIALAAKTLAQSGAHVAGLVLNKVAHGPDFRDYYAQYPYYLASDSRLFEAANSDSNGASASRPLEEARAK